MHSARPVQQPSTPSKDVNTTLSRPSLASHHSNSLPSTPRPPSRDPRYRSRTPSPVSRTVNNRSPRSVSSGSNRHLPSLRPTNPACRYQSTQTSRRRIPYTIGAEPLDPEKEEPLNDFSKLDQEHLNKSIQSLYHELLPSEENEERRRNVVVKLKRIQHEQWPVQEIDVSVFGSSGNLLCTSKSDVDVCITTRHLDTVCVLADVLAKRGMKNVTCVHAKAVPIVKIWDPEFSMACDLNVNNHVALKNTQMVRAYMGIDERVRPLAMLIKYWTKRRIINEASGGTLSSYTWTLLVIHFLQTRATPVLPVLVLRDAEGNPRDDFSADVEKLRGFGKANTESLAELFFRFFRHYGYEVDYDTAVISVRRGGWMTKKEKNWHLATNNRLCVEEPFNNERNLGNTADDTAFRGLHMEIRQAFSRIASNDDLTSSVCEPYTFPTDEHKSIFEKPPQQPRPVLSRSASQSGRGNRQGGPRGNKQRFNDQKNGGNNRRSSNSASYSQNNVYPPFLQSPQLVLPNGEYFFPNSTTGLSEELTRMSRQLSAEEQALRYKQLLMSQAHVQQAQAQAIAMSQNRGSSNYNNAPSNQQGRSASGSMATGVSSPRQNGFETPPHSGLLRYSFGQSMESPVAMSHTASQQGTNTNPSSPLMNHATPRRGASRSSLVDSPGGATRSQSQPARPIAPQYVPMGAPRGAYSGYMMPQQPPMRQDQILASGYPRHGWMGPFYNGQGGYFYLPAAAMDPVPREYLGYGIGDAPTYGSPPNSQTMSQFSGFDDAARNARGLSPRQRELSMSSTVSGVARSPSPLRKNQDHLNGFHSASSEHGDNDRPRATSRADTSGPLIVDGSLPTGSSGKSGDEELGSPQQRDFGRHTQQSSDTTFSSIGNSSTDDPTTSQHPLNRLGPNGSNMYNEQFPAFQRHQLPPTWISQPPAGRSGSTPSNLASGTGMTLSHEPPSSAETSPESLEHPHRRGNGSQQRNQVTPLDLGPSQRPDRPREQLSHNSMALSPVQETRTPSPTSSRKGHSRHTSQTNGANGATQQSASASAASGVGSSSASGKENQNGNIKQPAQAAINSHARAASMNAAIQQSNTWQQIAKRNGKKAKNAQHSNGGSSSPKIKPEKMPENVADRKGG